MNRVTVAVPQSLLDAANYTHVLLGKTISLNTYTNPAYQMAGDETQLFALSSGQWTDSQINGVISVKNSLLAGETIENALENIGFDYTGFEGVFGQNGLDKVAEAALNFEIVPFDLEEETISPAKIDKITAISHPKGISKSTLINIFELAQIQVD